ncbi:Uncharacterised protein [Raoultella terrigena]|uniref:Colicin transporter n=1 Tax=Raoultella terrigena TaxID=577 RepID=A0A3P8IY69_RAOTE|nr:Uncharacterised protein [Raoultella terrigena]
MTKEYYLKNILLGFLWAAIFIFTWFNDKDKTFLVSTLSIINALLFPFSRLFLESVLSKFISEKFKANRSTKNTSAENGLFAIFYTITFIFTPLILIIFLICKAVKSSR